MQRLIGSLCVVALASACGSPEQNATLITADEVADSYFLVDDEAALLATTVEGANLGKPGALRDTTMPVDVASLAAEQMASLFTPEGCLTATVDAGTVSYAFADCAGPGGLEHVSGTLVVVYDELPGGISIAASASGLELGGVSLDVDSSATFMPAGTTWVLSVVTSGQGEGPFGHSLVRDGAYALVWDGQCRTLYGSWAFGATALRDTTVPEGTRATALTRCQGACPAAGGSVVYNSEGGAMTITVTFDGTAKAAWTSTTGGKGSLDLPCTAAM